MSNPNKSRYPAKFNPNNQSRNRYPAPMPKRQEQNLVPSSFRPPNIGALNSIIPQFGRKDHNIAGRIQTTIQLKNSRGEEMNITQTQSVLNLLNNAQGDWFVGGNSNSATPRNHQKHYNKKR